MTSEELARSLNEQLNRKVATRHLVEDESLRAVAARLNVSYTTVRNHVQHILAKLHVHSFPAAVARYVLLGEDGLDGS
jgi:DNA-binding CsgD family transcriptional regulator